MGGHAGAITALAAARANVNAQDGLKMTPLHLAAQSGSVDAVRALLDTGLCAPRVKDLRGWTPRDAAVEAQHVAAARLLKWAEAAQATAGGNDWWGCYAGVCQCLKCRGAVCRGHSAAAQGLHAQCLSTSALSTLALAQCCQEGLHTPAATRDCFCAHLQQQLPSLL